MLRARRAEGWSAARAAGRRRRRRRADMVASLGGNVCKW